MLSVGRCVGCQRQVLSAFVNSFRPIVATAGSDTISLPVSSRQRSFSTQPPSFVQVSQRRNEITVRKEDLSTLTEGERTETPEEAPAPWYLQLDGSDIEMPNPFAARQQLPELPHNPPPILQPMLKHISVDLGLDYLSVLDLRSLDPPPALGAGTILIFGSVRSFKHLNVSADRLCRWLRANYNLTPHADGLLGRNELKLKLRRRARRAKILSAAGGVEPADTDDGITTGWICVNVGEVEDGPEKTSEQRGSHNKGYVGFGRETSSARIVVQMMTEEKRNETDLEGLWQALIDREGRKKEGERKAWEKLDQEAAERRPERIPTPSTSSEPELINARQAPLSTGLSRHTAQQVRAFHTSNWRHNADRIRIMSSEDSTKMVPGMFAEQPPTSSADASLLSSKTDPHLRTSEISRVAYANSSTSAGKLQTLLNHLKTLDASSALQQLGIDEKDRSSTNFVMAFHTSFPVFPELEHFLCMLQLQCHALKLGHAGYTRLRLVEIFRDMQAHSIWIPREVFIFGLETILMSDHHPNDQIEYESAELQRLSALRRSFGFAFEVIERMEAHGYEVRTQDVLLLILEAISRVSASSEGSPSGLEAATDMSVDVPHTDSDNTKTLLDTWNVAKLQYRFRRALDILDHPTLSSDDPIYLALMQACIRTGHWSEFWETWRHVARMAKRRGEKMYTLLFSEVARTGNEAKCQDVLLTCFPELSRESPPVEMKAEVAVAVLQCLVAARINEQDNQWKGIANSCRAALATKRLRR